MRASLRIILFALCVFGVSAAAQPSLVVTVLNTNPRFRTGAPGNLHVQIENTTPGIREGVLETTVFADNEQLLSHETPLALAPGKSKRTLFIPLLNSRSADMRVDFRFVADGQSQSIGTHVFRSGFGRDSLVLHAVAGKPSEQHTRLARTLRPERVEHESSAGEKYMTNSEWLAPNELPQNPLAYMAYDLVVVDHRALVSAKEKALTALSRWVDAGGSVLVSPEKGVQLPDEAERFLARLAIDDPVGDGTRWLAPGLGRAVIWRDHAPSDIKDDPKWDKATAFLWKTDSPRRLRENERYYSQEQPVLEQVVRNIQHKLGSGVRPLSFNAVAGWFVLFIFLTAAFDYFVLGRRFRKYTWGIFPVQCALFAWLMMHMANARLGEMKRTASVVVTDLGIDGRVLRETKFVGILPGATSRADYATAGAFVRPVRSADLNGEMHVSERHQNKPRYVGATMQVMHEKWTPSFIRETSIPEAPDPSGLKWEKWRADDPEKSAPAIAGGRTDVAFAARLPDTQITAQEWSRHRWGAMSPTGFIAENAPWDGKPFSQFAPLGGEDRRDMMFPVFGTKRAVVVAVITEGNVSRVFRKLYSRQVFEP